MTKRKINIPIKIVTFILLLSIAWFGYFVVKNYYRYQPKVDKEIMMYYAKSKDIPTVVKYTIGKVYMGEVKKEVIRMLTLKYVEVNKNGRTNWDLIDYIWQEFINMKYSRNEIIAYYYYNAKIGEGVYGFENGAKVFMNKDINNFSAEDVIELLVISRSPYGYWPKELPDKFKLEKEYFKKTFGAV